MESFSFTVTEGFGAGYTVNVGTTITGTILAFEFKKNKSDPWASSNLVTITEAGSTSLLMSVPVANATSALAPCYYRVLSNGIAVLNGRIYFANAQPGSSAALDAETVRDTIGAALVAGTNITITPDDPLDTITISSPLQSATETTFTATGNIAATNVQSAVAELDTEKVGKAGGDVVGAPSTTTVPLAIQGAEATRSVTTKALTANVATLTTSVAHNFKVGKTVVVSGVDATFDGTYTIKGIPTATTFTYDKTAVDVASVAATGTARSYAHDSNLQEWRDSGGAVLTRVAPDGTIWIGASQVTDAEAVRDIVGATLTAGTNVTVTVNDAADTITISSTGDPEFVRDTIAAALVAGTNMSVVIDDVANTITLNATDTNTTDPEVVMDTVAAGIVAGANITKTYDDVAGTLTITSTDTNTTDPEVVMDTVSTGIVAGTNVTTVYDDVAGTLTISSTDTNTTDPEVVRDTIATALTAGANIAITPDDVGDKITVAATGVATLDADGDVPASQLDKVRAVPIAGRIVTVADTLGAADDVLYVDGAVTITVSAAALGGSSVIQIGTGQVTLAAGVGVTLQGNLKTAGQWQGVSIYERPGVADTYIVVGGVV